ncbi:hypothetical protein KJA16_03360 [Patescibacteria group bacterium]|nr:hypothetical protein [Patescibacteria group bacterium]
MNLKKKINISLIPVLGASIILVFLIVSIFVFQKNLIFPPEVRANPGTCTVNDDVQVNGWLRLTPQVCDENMPCTPDMAGRLVVCDAGCPTCGKGSRCFIICDWDGNWNCVEDLQ